MGTCWEIITSYLKRPCAIILAHVAKTGQSSTDVDKTSGSKIWNELDAILVRGAQDVIDARRREAEDEGEELGPDLISRFLMEGPKFGVESFSNKELRDTVLNFLLAGRDTTAVTLSRHC